ncbi:Golgi phosphoprotein 3 GPP34 [Kribbella sp. VKM Ac-2571]|uniref:GOLPH3/VPS74 family protein n=1 Tax=Kribbella sp. VKM Ac-2571 TaxID=2512222 RepID=UPI0010620F53|nr:GPP34 family phosphoprotein [Kribbella sp. VKM Ac-2571]TDO68297.1 Golgi phosphoprotein 3 GPP34 [Kribbella sp. VKM Ac-2571]
MSRAVVTPLRRPERSTSARRPARPRKTVALGNAAAPDSLAARVFLLAYDPERGRLTARSKLGKVLRAAVLIDLQLNGNIEDDGGRARVTTPEPRSTGPRSTGSRSFGSGSLGSGSFGSGGLRSAGSHSAGSGSVGSRSPGSGSAPVPVDPVVAAVLEELRAMGPRRWRHWIDRRAGATVRQVRDELARTHLIQVEPHRVLGIFPAARITLRHPLVRRHILQSARDTLRPSRPVTRVDLRDAAVVVLASTADLRTVVTKEQRARHKDRLTQLAVRVGPVVPALKKSLQQSQYSAGG